MAEALVTFGIVFLLALGLILTSAELFTPERPAGPPFQCPHGDDPLCRRFGCPDDPAWQGDRH